MILAEFSLASILLTVLASECEVSDWTEWSQCFGTCYFGQTVRNRDVTRPSLPDRPGSPTRRCPHLYETSFCAPDSCKQGSSEGDDRFRTPDRSILPPRIVLEKQIMHKGRMGSDAAEPLRPSNDAKAKGPLKDEERRLRLSEGMSQMRLLRPVDRLPELLQSQAKNRVRSFESEILKEGRVRSKDDSIEEASLNIDETPVTVNVDVPLHLKPAKERKGRRRINNNNNDDSSLSEVVRELESTGNFKLPLDEKHIRSVLKKNKKLMKALVETYKLKTTTAISFFSTTDSEDTFGALNTTKDIIDEDGTESASALPDLSEFTTTGEELLNVEEVTTATNISNFSPESTTESMNSTTSKNLSTTRSTSTDAFVATTSISTTLEPKTSSEDFLPVTSTENPLHNTLTLDAEITLDYGDISKTEGSAREVEDEANESSTSTTSTTTSTTSDTSTSTTTTLTPPYWPKKGYVPNTRKHASEITSKLYMTHEIVQALSADPVRRSPIQRLDCVENRRCCKITRSECSDGSIPKYIKRYYRPRGSDVCVPYHYPRCSQGEEMEEQPIQYEQNCQDLCFKGPEKRISPLLTLADN